jgi:hypothetical protein
MGELETLNDCLIECVKAALARLEAVDARQPLRVA